MMAYRIVKRKGEEIEHFDFHHRRYEDALNKYFDIVSSGDFNNVKLCEILLNDMDECVASYTIEFKNRISIEREG